MQTAVVYQALAPNGARYIGVTSQVPRKRWAFHVSTAMRGTSACKRLAQAIRDFGMTEADFRVLARFPSLDTAKACERDIVEKCRPALNMTRGGDCRPPHTAESKAKIGAASKGNAHRLGHKASAETRARMSAAHIGNTHRTGATQSAETRAKIADGVRNSVAYQQATAARRGVANPAHAEKLRGRKASPETRAKMSQSQKARRAAEAAR